MGSLLRSHDVKLLQLFLQIDSAHSVVDELLLLGCVEFRDVNHTVNILYRKYTPEIRRWDEVSRRLSFFREELRLYEKAFPNNALTTLMRNPSMVSLDRHMTDEMEAMTQNCSDELKELRATHDELENAISESAEILAVLNKDPHFFEQRVTAYDSESQAVVGVLVKEDAGYSVFEEVKKKKGMKHKPLETYSSQHVLPQTSNVIKIISGVIARDQIKPFSTLLWRVTRGNIFVKFVDIEEPLRDPLTGLMVAKSVFVMFCQSELLSQKIRKVAGSLHARIYDIPTRMQDRIALRSQAQAKYTDLQIIMSRVHERRRQVLSKVASNISMWEEMVMKKKAICHVMNMCNQDVSSKCLIGEAWCPTDSVAAVAHAFQKGTSQSGSQIHSFFNEIATQETPPTYYKLDDLTRPFQMIVDAYGVARFQELNPGPFTIITFPFLFAVMFGDVGHGLMMLLFALYLIFRPQSSSDDKSEVAQALAGGRYMILLMSLFSIYVGAIYGEAFSLPIPWFESGWAFSDDSLRAEKLDWVYPFGVDHNWIRKENDLEFFNSLKMKLSIILGVAHMTLGIFLSCANHIHFKRWSSILCEFLPQLLFMMCIFGYMVFLIMLKWFIDWSGREAEAPLLVNTMIDMFLHPGTVAFPMFAGQDIVQSGLVIVALLCIPWMLLSKPLVSYFSRPHHGYETVSVDEESIEGSVIESNAEVEVHSFADEFTHQTIHTIEYALGAVSNTASYLRLWALSLAHSELSKVFWDQIMILGIESGNMIVLFVCFAIWASVTVCVMLMMESLSAFLHALRLHWVEFQNKFYTGDGVALRPSTYQSLSSTN